MITAQPAKKQKVAEEAPAKGGEAEKQDANAELEELEQDAKRDGATKISGAVTFFTRDTTMNIMPCTQGNLLATVSEGGLQHFVAGARANVGIKSGRYMFEAKIIEQMNTMDDAGKHAAMPKNMLRVGFSTDASSLFLGDEANSICFDMSGNLIHNRQKTKCSKALSRESVVAVVLNLDSKSSNSNTVSCFKDGVRVSAPQKLPEALQGVTLFPTISFKNMTVHCNFGPPSVPLAFKCNAVGEASTKDSVVNTQSEPDGGNYNVLFPVSLPDEGTFDWLDAYLDKHPEYTEISDRAILQWASKSGLTPANKKRTSNDAPEFSFGIPSIDDSSTRKMLLELAQLQPRHFVIMSVKDNLIRENRTAAMNAFKMPGFKTVAEVIIGEGTASFKLKVEKATLAEKQAASDAKFKAKKAEEKRQWLIRKKVKEQEKMKKRAEKERKKKLEEMKKKKEEMMKKKEEGDKSENDKALEEAQKKKEEEEKKAEEEEEEEPDEPEPDMDEEPPSVELTAEEKAIRFFNHPIKDLTEFVLNTTFPKYSIPEQDEGFDSLKFAWYKRDKATEYMKQWISAKKLTTRIETITPGDWFRQRHMKWQMQLQGWKTLQNQFRAQLAKKVALKQAAAAKKIAEERKKKALEAKKAAEDAKKTEEQKAKEKEEEAKKEAEKKEEEEKKVVDIEDEEEEEPEVDFEGADPFGVPDISDIGQKMPLFKEFQFEDFAMLSLRFEIHLLAHAFSKDTDDPDRTGIHLDHLAFYYQKYYNKPLLCKSYGCETDQDLVAMLDDTVFVAKSIIEPLVQAELETNDIFVRITEEARRYRNLRLDMGEEEARLKIKGPQGQPGLIKGQAEVAGKNTIGAPLKVGSVGANQQWGAWNNWKKTW